MKRAVFLDRDGVINIPVVKEGRPYPPVKTEDFILYPEVLEACHLLKAAGFFLAVATNQPDVGRGTQKKEVVEAMNALMCTWLPIDHIEVCYDRGQGEPSEFHKPAPGMLLRAARLFEIDLGSSYMIGDRWRDIDCGHAAGCKTIFIERGYDEALKKEPDYKLTNLMEAAQLILNIRNNKSQ